MTHNTQDQIMTNDSDESKELKPVKGSFGKILSIGTKIVVGGAVMAVVIPLIAPRRTLGVTRSARLKYEQRKAEIEKATADTVKEESEITTNEKTETR